jgi:HPt (histidine-containing phosphotransfer) domain-containing protein
VHRGPAADARAPAILDRAGILERFEGDTDLLREVVQLFLAECPRRMADLRQALAQGDADALQCAAHSLKGSAGNFNAEAVVAAAGRLEMMGRLGDLTGARDACAVLEQEITRLTGALATML